MFNSSNPSEFYSYSWNEVISTSSKITRNFTLNLCDNNRWISKFDQIMSLTRRFQLMSVTLHSSDQPYSQETWTDNAINLLCKTAGKHGTSIRKLMFQNAELENTKDFCSILSNMPLLNELTLRRVKVNIEDDFTSEKQVMLSKLNKLTVLTCDWNIFKFFMASPIKELLISNKFAFVDVQQHATYTKFLETSAKLESIEFDLSSYAKTFKNQMDGRVGFQLKRLKFLSFSSSYEMDDIDRNFGTFLESQAASLTELELNYVSPHIIKIIFTKLTHLRKLRLNTSVLPDNNEFYGSFKTMPHLKELTLHDDLPSEAAVKEILVNCSNLETITAHHDPGHFIPSLLMFMTANTPMIKHLSIDTLPVEISPEVKFHHLKFFHLQTCHNLENLIKFLNSNAVIETLSLNLTDELIIPDDAVLEALLSQPNLQHLKVGAGDTTLNAIYEKIKVDYRNLKSLELRPLTNAANKFLIKFPIDPSQWKPSELIFDNQKNVCNNLFVNL